MDKDNTIGSEALINGNRKETTRDAVKLANDSLGPRNSAGEIFHLLPHLVEKWKKLPKLDRWLRLEAGQHRLRAIRQLDLQDHKYLWPAQIYKRNFSTDVLNSIRTNREEVAEKDLEADALSQLSGFFRSGQKISDLNVVDRNMVNEKFDKLKGGKSASNKLKTMIFKPVFGAAVRGLIGAFPNVTADLTELLAGKLSGSVHPGVCLHFGSRGAIQSHVCSIIKSNSI